MSSLLNPNHTAAYDPASDRIVLTFRDGREHAIVELDPSGVPSLINAMMEAIHRAKAKAKAGARPTAPPPVRIGPRPSPARCGVLGMHGPRGGGRARRS